MTKYIIAALVAAAGLLGFLYWKADLRADDWHVKLVHMTGERDRAVQALRRAEAARERDAQVLARLAEEKRATARELASTRAVLADALAENRAWAEAPVPAQVLEILNAQ